MARRQSCIKRARPRQKTALYTDVFWKTFMLWPLKPAPKINIPINTVAAPCNSLPACLKEASFVNLLLETWTEMRLLNTSVGALRARPRARCSGSAPALRHFGSHSPPWSCGRGAAKKTLRAVGPRRQRETDFGRVLLAGLSWLHPNPAGP